MVFVYVIYKEKENLYYYKIVIRYFNLKLIKWLSKSCGIMFFKSFMVIEFFKMWGFYLY